MFTVHCPGHDAVVLLGSRSIDALVTTPAGVEVHWHCRCGSTGVLVPRTGSASALAPAPAGRHGRVAA